MREEYAEIADSGLGSIAALCSAAPPAVTVLTSLLHRWHGFEPYAAVPSEFVPSFSIGDVFLVCPPRHRRFHAAAKLWQTPLLAEPIHVAPAAVAPGKPITYRDTWCARAKRASILFSVYVVPIVPLRIPLWFIKRIPCQSWRRIRMLHVICQHLD